MYLIMEKDGFHIDIRENFNYLFRVYTMKKLLIISQNALSEHANNGKTLTNIFQAWDHENLAQIYFQDEIPESSKFNRFYRVRDIDLVKKMVGILQNPVAQVNPLPWVESHYKDRSDRLLKIINILKKFGFARDISREILYKLYFLYLKDLELDIEKFKPDVLFVVASDYSFTLNISLRLARRFNIPIYLYILDDRFFMRKKSVLSSIYNNRYLSAMKKIVDESQHCFCIGGLMSEEYSKYFDKPFHVLANPIDNNNLNIRQRKYENNTKTFKFLYAGGLTIGRYDALLEFNKILIEIQKFKNITIEFIVCSGDNLNEDQIQELKNYSIKFLGRLNNNELDRVYKSVDFITHIESDKPRNMKLTKFSISTKIPECMFRGVCLIGFGPSEIASMKLIYENNIGFYVNIESTFEEKVSSIIQLLESPKLCDSLVSNAVLFGEDNFTYHAVSDNIISIIEG